MTTNLSLRNKRPPAKSNGGGASVEIKNGPTKPKTKTKLMTKRGVGPFDAAIGQRVRIRRNELGVSQNELGDMLGVSFQQIQKYEKGVNRVSSGRLMQIAEVLKTTTDQLLNDGGKTKSSSAYNDFLVTREGPMLMDAMIAIKNVEHRRIVVTLARELAQLS